MSKNGKIKNVILNGDGSLKEVSQFGDEDLFDDCPICQAIKRAKEEGREPTETEMREAFKKSKDAGGSVGGEWFEDKKQGE
jgi:hypothetical protein